MSGLDDALRSNANIHHDFQYTIGDKKEEVNPEKKQIKELSSQILKNLDSTVINRLSEKKCNEIDKDNPEAEQAKEIDDVFDQVVIEKSYEYGRGADSSEVQDQHSRSEENHPQEVQENQSEIDELPLEEPDYQIETDDTPLEEPDYQIDSDELPLEEPDYQIDSNESQTEEDELPLEEPDYQIDTQEGQTQSEKPSSEEKQIQKTDIRKEAYIGSNISEKLNAKNGLSLDKISYKINIDSKVDLKSVNDISLFLNDITSDCERYVLSGENNFKITNNINEADFIKTKKGDKIVVLNGNPEEIIKTINKNKEKLGIPQNQPLTFYIVDKEVKDHFILEFSKRFNLAPQINQQQQPIEQKDKKSIFNTLDTQKNSNVVNKEFVEIVSKNKIINEAIRKLTIDEVAIKKHQKAAAESKEAEALDRAKVKSKQVVEYMNAQYQRHLELVKDAYEKRDLSKGMLTKEELNVISQSWAQSMPPFEIRLVNEPVIHEVLMPEIMREIHRMVEKRLTESQLLDVKKDKDSLIEETPFIPSSQTPRSKRPERPPLDTRTKRRRIEG